MFFIGNRSRKLMPFALAIAGAVCVLAWILVREPRLWGLLRNSLKLAAGTAAISLPVGTLFGFFLFRTNLAGRTVLLWLIISALFVPLYVYAAAWSAGFGQLGWFPLVGDLPRPLLDGWLGAIWVHAMAAIPWVAVIVGIAALSVDPTLEENALLDANALRVFTVVTLPRILPAVGVAALWILITTMGEMTVSDIFRIRTYVEEVFLNYQLDQMTVAPILRPWEDSLDGFSIGIWTQLAVVVWLALAALLLIATLVPISHVQRQNPAMVFELRSWRYPATLLVGLLVVLVLAVPLGNLVYKAGLHYVTDAAGTHGNWTIARFNANLAAVPERYGENFYWTALLAVCAASLALLISLPLAWLARSASFIRSIPAVLFAASGFALPGPTIGVLLILLLDRPDSPFMVWLYDRTLFAPAVAIAMRTMPLSILFCWHVMRGVSDIVLDHAKLEGIGPLRRFFIFGIEQNKLSMLAAWLLALVIAFGDLSASNLVMPPRVDPLQRLIFGFIHSGVDDQVAILSLSNILFVLPLIVAFGWLVSRRRNSC